MTQQMQQQTVLSWLKDAHAMEVGAIPTLTGHAEAAAHYPEVRAKLEAHAEATRRHAELVEGCIARLGGRPSALKEAVGGVLSSATGGKAGTETPTGIFRIDARHRNHTSSLYQVEDKSAQYPMDNAMRFYIGPDNVSYWIHARDLPGRPASHGCVGLFDEAMQNRMFGTPVKPALLDSKKLYDWAVGEAEYEEDTGNLEELEDGPVVEIIGKIPEYRDKPLQSAALRR